MSHCYSFHSDPTKQFTPLYLTICGEGGTGKTFLIHLIISIFKRLFERDDDQLISYSIKSFLLNKKFEDPEDVINKIDHEQMLLIEAQARANRPGPLPALRMATCYRKLHGDVDTTINNNEGVS